MNQRLPLSLMRLSSTVIHEGDPYEAEYRLWVDQTPDLSPALNALLKGREQALQEKDVESAKEMQREACKFGIMVKDRGKFQYWRNLSK
ncbi:CysS/YqeB C-terminal domain-containing protein [Brevibacillus borstelensis]|uniref:CysS/YqeB C-terminal domain-containing protein n=1 Tax=Brevibacillus borstelensis TaxID=45462 RepID=UPI003D1AECC3